ncbi:non-specific lipid transfer protein GPI-anchored 6 [Benincasa hispida]|uniref:non-specific lipid transfer protein GPI-anchored 6 n=1 Tax=Benincasa hispida TaxID=102211 RepID=UPI001901D7B6|nr:non-specific lipid transfer protein GPI-anchored 6 [Benincasa hispida]
MASTSTHLLIVMALLFVGFVSSNIDQDRAECADQVVGLATCLPYVGGEAKAPTPDCCSGLNLVLQKSRKCLCILIKDRDDPSLGLKVNLTLALGLPTACHTPADIKDCIGLLHLSPNSKEAKDFLETNPKGSNTTSAPATAVSGNSTQNSEAKNDGGTKRNQWLGVEIFVWFSTSSFLLTCIW